jgi:protoporphyrinogen/coproporphyrinogen III oxidase
MKRLLVIGGGLAGLAAAWRARRAGAEVRLLETAAQPGGVVQSVRENGFLTESGPNTLMASSPAFIKLLSDLGLENQIISSAPAARERFIVRDGKLVPAPLSVWHLLTTPLLSPTAKLRLLGEPLVKRRPADATGDESLAGFARRRLGAEAFTCGLEPFVAGIFAGDPEKLSARHALPRLHALERDAGSVLRGLWQARKKRPVGGASRLISFRDGAAALPRALATQLGDTLILRAQLNFLERNPTGTWTAEWTTPTGRAREGFDGVTLAVPAYAVVDLPLPPNLKILLAPLGTITHPPVSVVSLGFPRQGVGHPLDGFGALIPAVEKFSVLGVLFNSTLFPERAPTGQVLLTVFVGGARQPALAALPDVELVARVLADLKKLLAVSSPPIFQKVIRWPRAIPQYDLEHGARLAAIEAAERTWPGLTLAGSYRGGVSVPDGLATGQAAGLRALNLSPSAGE